jgi:hypothetical protein
MSSTTRRLAGLLVAGIAAAVAPLLATGTANAGATDQIEHQLNLNPAAQSANSWFSGTVAAGSTQSWVWNNANPSLAYVVALSPVGASTSAACQFETTRSWDVQQPSGEREFHFVIQNTGSIACGTNILLSWQSGDHTWSTGGIDAGASKSWTWNNANPLDAVYLPGLNPSGATGSASCQLEVTSYRYARLASGEREFRFTVQNVGSIACQGTVLLAQMSPGNSFNTSTIGAGTTVTAQWNNAPTNLVFVPGLTPVVASPSCVLQIDRLWYRQRIKADGTATRELLFTIHNTGSVGCSATVQLAFFAA